MHGQFDEKTCSISACLHRKKPCAYAQCVLNSELCKIRNTCAVLIPYSGKFSLVQTFVELPVNPSQEIFVVLIVARASAIPYNAYLNFRGSYFRDGRPIREKCESLHHAKISRYTVANEICQITHEYMVVGQRR